MTKLNYQVLLTVIVPIPLEEAVADLMLTQPDLVKGFTTSRVAGHGTSIRLVASEELVRGYAGRSSLETLCPDMEQVHAILELLKSHFEGANLFYWVTPVLESGRLS